MRLLSADILFPIHTKPVKDHVLILKEDGTILDIMPKRELDPLTIENHSGALVPGFINTHCHLELSHLKGSFKEKTGLPDFLMNITKHRDAVTEGIVAAMQNAEAEMYNNGIVAVGDISNNDISFAIKANRKIHYHTFVELIAFDPFNAFKVMAGGEKLLSAARDFAIHASLAPHAPYSVSPELIKLINRHCYENGKPTSIHMLESNDENEWYMQGTGLYRKLYRELNVDISHFQPSRKTALETLLPYFNRNVKTLLVHNTIATAWDADWAEDLHPNLFWCFCPNANLFIEDRLPDIATLKQHVQYITIGTDSLSSNHTLSILDELKTIHNKFPEIKPEELLRWATLYGAKFLGIEEQYGSFEKGKKPGVNLMEHYSTDAESITGLTLKKLL